MAASARVLWKRLPTYFPNIKLQLVPLSEASVAKLLDTGHLDEVRRAGACAMPGCRARAAAQGSCTLSAASLAGPGSTAGVWQRGSA